MALGCWCSAQQMAGNSQQMPDSGRSKIGWFKPLTAYGRQDASPTGAYRPSPLLSKDLAGRKIGWYAPHATVKGATTTQPNRQGG